MKRFLPVSLALIAACGASLISLRAQSQSQTPTLTTPDQVIDRYEQVIGGHAGWDKLHSLTLKGNVEVQGHLILSGFSNVEVAPAKSVTKLSNGARTILAVGCDGAACWGYEPTHGLQPVTGDALAQQLADSDFYGGLDLRKRYHNWRFIGTDTQGAMSVYILETSPKPDTFVRMYFDTISGFKTREETTTESSAGENIRTTYFEDYHQTNGVFIPYTKRLSEPDLTVHITQAQWNGSVDDSQFAMPALESLQPSAPASKPATVAEIESVSPTGKSGSGALRPESGSVSGGVYRNDYFGFTYQFPADWSIAPAATTEHLMAVGKEIASGGNEQKKAILSAAEQRTYPIVTITQYPFGTPGKRNQIIQLMAEDISYAPGLTSARDYTGVVLQSVVATGAGFEVLRQPAAMNFGGREFYGGELIKRSPVSVYQWYVSNVNGGMALTFIFTATDQAQADAQLHTLDSLVWK